MKYWLLLFLLLIPLSGGATITGTVYDYGLQPVTDAVVTISTSPEQTTVTKSGAFSLEAPAGTYTLKVHKVSRQGLQEKAEAEITVPENGTFNYDLILFQELEQFENHEELEVILEGKQSTWPYWLFLIIGLFAVIAGAIKLRKKKESTPKKEDSLEDQVLLHVKQQGTLTQKELRKSFPVSEAKISLIIASLESEGKITKIKKGRGNIIKYHKVKR